VSINGNHTAAPGLFWSLFEAPRAIAEASMLLPTHNMLRKLPGGDGHSVMTVPGFLAGDTSTGILRRYLSRWGYRAHPWRLGRNLGLRRKRNLEAELVERVEHLYIKSGNKVTLIGWSLGGLMARELARSRPELVRGVITLGSPLGNPKATNVWRMYQMVTGTRISDPDIAERIKHLQDPLPGVPSTAIYSRSDAIVSWQISREPVADHTENIEVIGSHLGLGINPMVLYVIADRLHHLSNGGWKPFEYRDLRKLFYN
jgi:pimeloyl-ACP methyl ester carboxylesterase